MGNKYKNVKVSVNGIVFDSKKEAERYKELATLERLGIICDLRRQVSFELIPKTPGERAVKYVADFSYKLLPHLETFVEDVKGYRTEAYIIKRKLFKWRYPDVTFLEV